MPRHTRIQLVTGLAFLLVGVLIPIIGSIVLTIMVQNGAFAHADDVGGIPAEFAAIQRVGAISQNLYLVGMGLAGGAFLYTLIVLAAWFIGPADKGDPKGESES